ncbi:MAG: Bug family tripartite tricarboxylate transporter substrate binding protein [Burkholderiales bacterium]
MTLAQDYPIKPIKLIIPFQAGIGVDASTRQVTSRLTPILGQPVVIENRPGGSTIIGTEYAAKAAPDGYTLYIGASTAVAVIPYLYSKLPYNIERDFAPISQTSVSFAGILANAEVPVKDVKDFIALSKKRSLNIGTIGNGSNYHLFGAWFSLLTGADFNYIHYNTSQPVIDVIAGRLEAIFDGLSAHGGNLRAGKLKLLAVSGKERRPAYPDVPTFTEAGLGEFEPLAWGGFFAPTGTPQPILDKIGVAVARVVRSPEMVELVRATGNEPVGNSPAEFSAFVKTEQAKWSKVIKQLGIRLD